MADTTFNIRVVCDETDPATDFSVITITIKEVHVAAVQIVITKVMALLGVWLLKFQWMKYATKVLEWLGFTVNSE